MSEVGTISLTLLPGDEASPGESEAAVRTRAALGKLSVFC